MRHVMLALVAAAALAACSKDDPAPSTPPPPGCDQVTLNGTCTARAGLTAADCSFGTFRPEGCPQASIVGTCIDAQGESTSYYSPQFEAYVAHYFCELASGAWIGSGAPQVRMSCDDRADSGTCSDMTGPQDEVEFFTSLCGTNASSTPCPTAGRTGTCTSSSAAVTFDTRFYDAATTGADAAACISGGDTWTPN